MSLPSKYEMLRRRLPELTLVHDESFVATNILKEIYELSNEALLGGTIENADMAQAARAGVILEAGGWDPAHRIVQEMEIQEAEYWHGIIHRREPDSSNAKYWFRRVGQHPVMDQLARKLTNSGKSQEPSVQMFIKGGKWDPFTFVDACLASYEGGGKELLPLLLDIQQKEFTLLLDHCIQHALRQPKKALKA